MGNTLKPRPVETNAVLNVIRQLFSVVFPMITFPYVTRILGAENYGKYTFSLSIVNYISYIAAAGIMRYAIRECARVRDDSERLKRLVNEIFTINVTTTVFAFVLLFLLLAFVPLLKEYALWIMILSLSILFSTLGTDWINSAFEDYLFITVRYVLSQTAAIIMLFLLVRKADDIAQYAFVSVLGGIMANLMNILHIRKTIGIFPKLAFSKALAKHVKPIFYLFICTVATFIYINSDVTILGIYADNEAVGYYGASVQFYQLVKQLINAAFVVVIPRISNELAKDKSVVYERYNKILTVTILLLIPCATGLFMIRRNLIVLFSGEAYARAASSLAILAVALVPAMLANFFINIVMIPQKLEKQVTVATVISALINIVLNFILIPSYEENAAAFTTLIAEIAMVAIAMLYCRKIRFGNQMRPIGVGCLGGALIVAVCILIGKTELNLLFNVILSVIISVAVYGAVMYAFYRSDIISAVQRLRNKG